MDRPERTRPDYTLLAHRPDGTPVCALACGPDYPTLRRRLLIERKQTDLQLLILPTEHIKGA